MIFTEVNSSSEANIPPGGMQIWHPMYRDVPLKQVIKHSQVKSEYVPYGYNYFVLVRGEGTVYAFRKHSK